MLPSRVFVTGTDTNIGKTVVAAILTCGLKARYWKPIQSGLSEPPEALTDTQWVQSRLGLTTQDILAETYRFALPASPQLAASREGVRINMAEILTQFRSFHDDFNLVVEGAGGILVPLNEQELMIDLISELKLPTIVVASTRLGTINHTLLTIEALRSRNIEVVGIVLNGLANQATKEAIENFSSLAVIAEIPQLSNLDKATLKATYETQFLKKALSLS